MGVRLFERTSFGIQPTREAETLARRVQLAFNEISQAQAEVNALSDQWMLAQQPLTALMQIGLLAFLVPFVRDSLRSLLAPPPAAAVPGAAAETPSK